MEYFSDCKAWKVNDHITPEMLRPERISAANGVMGLTTVTATVIGMAGGNVLTDMTGTKGQQGWWLSACVLIGLAVVGWLCSLTIKPLPIANRERRFPWDAPWQTVRACLRSIHARSGRCHTWRRP